MSDALQLLDTPKRISLQSQSTQIRAALKDFERTFAANNDGRKPSKDDIKADTDIAAKYKEYGKIRDVLAGRLEYAALISPPRSPTQRRKHVRTDSGVSWSPRKKDHDATPRKPSHPSQLDPYDVIRSASPKPFLLPAIGPTPQRDGKVLGLFDLLSNSAHSLKSTPSSKKRKLGTFLDHSPGKAGDNATEKTPSQRKVRKEGDLLEFLTGTPARIPGHTPETGHRRHSKTPISEGRKFMLSQFFATPSTVRYSSMDANHFKAETPLRDQVLGATPEKQGAPLLPAADMTPAYLRRTTSFKDRLLSASQPALRNVPELTSPPVARIGPPTLRHLRPVTKIFSEAVSSVPDQEDDEHEDEMEALRELEDSQINVLVKDSQLQSGGSIEYSQDQPVQKVWKKRGQKRTTRKSNMRPVKGPIASAPKFVAAGDESDEEDEVSQVPETQLRDQTGNSDPPLDDEEYIDGQRAADSDSERERATNRSKSKSKIYSSKDKDKSKPKSKGPTINPNATAHMNFRSLKIKNKNSKAKGRGGRFGRGRR